MRTHLETSGSSKVNKVGEANTFFLEIQLAGQNLEMKSKDISLPA